MSGLPTRASARGSTRQCYRIDGALPPLTRRAITRDVDNAKDAVTI